MIVGNSGILIMDQATAAFPAYNHESQEKTTAFSEFREAILSSRAGALEEQFDARPNTLGESHLN